MTIKANIHQYLAERTGLVVHAADIAKDLGAKESTVRSAVSNLAKSGFNIQSPFRGAYRYMGDTRPEAKPTSTLFEKLGESKTGKIVLQDEEGNLYVAEAL